MPIDKALKVNPQMENTPRMRKSVLAASVAILLGLMGSNAAALSLGRLTVQSALGQPLRAEIEIPEINAEEADSFRGSVAAAEAFKAAGLEFNPAINNLQVTLQRRADGKMVLKLSGDRIVNEPFIDLILEANWSSGRTLRDYTLLFDPPSLREAAAPTAPQISAAVPAAAPAQRTAAPAVAREVPAPKPQAQRPAPAATAAPVAVAPATVKKPAAEGAKQVTVRPGDTASKIAGSYKPASVSLDQMLVALLRSNPDAFAGNNVNRLKSGAVLDLPSSEQVLETPRDAAAQTVLAQSKDFNDFRHHLAGAAPTAAAAPAGRQASGKVQATVEDKKAAAPAPDKLTLSKATAQSKAADDKIAAERQAKDAAVKTAELARNIAELNKLKPPPAPVSPAAPVAPTAAVAPAAPVAAVASQPKPALAVVAPVVVAPVAVASAPVQAAASKPAAAKPVVKASAAAPAQEPSFIDGLIENPLVPGGGLLIAALLAGFAVFRSRQSKRGATGESSFLDSHLQPDSFFGASGGEQVDTSNDSAISGGSSMIYSPSQLDASGEVDPVAEADVYLAYGRDQQAEDILKDALQTTPSRVAIHAKLADIYAKRADAAAFNANAAVAFGVSQGMGAEWEHIRDLGRELDRDNALYQPEGVIAPLAEAQPEEAQAAPAKAAAPVDLDLDFDLDLDAAPSAASERDEPSMMGVLHDSDLSSEPIELYEAPASEPASLAVSAPAFEPAATAPIAAAPAAAPSTPQVVAPELGDLADFAEAPTPLKIKSQTATSSVPPAPPEMLSFDLGALSLDLEPAAAPAAAAEEPDTDSLDPLATKLALAREFQSIGDNDGAHALAEEVFTLATGELRAEAKRFLSELGFAQSGFAQSNF